MNPYEARRQAKADRMREYAENAQKRGDAAYQKAHQLMDQIPLGQPILVGHHSERHARRDAERIDNGMRTAFAEQDRAATWAGRAAAVEESTAISGWDPDAPEKIQERIAELEAERTAIKVVNAAIRKHGLEKAADSLPRKYVDELLQTIKVVWPAEKERIAKRGFPAYKLQYLGANIKRLQDRLALMERRKNEHPGFLKVVPNKYAGKCEDCGTPVGAREGFYASDLEGNAGVKCGTCLTIGKGQPMLPEAGHTHTDDSGTFECPMGSACDPAEIRRRGWNDEVEAASRREREVEA